MPLAGFDEPLGTTQEVYTMTEAFESGPNSPRHARRRLPRDLLNKVAVSTRPTPAPAIPAAAAPFRA